MEDINVLSVQVREIGNGFVVAANLQRGYQNYNTTPNYCKDMDGVQAEAVSLLSRRHEILHDAEMVFAARESMEPDF